MSNLRHLDVALRDMFSGGLGSVRLMAGPSDLKGQAHLPRKGKIRKIYCGFLPDTSRAVCKQT